MSTPKRIFISYRKKDGDNAAQHIQQYLTSHPAVVAVFLDSDGIHGGEKFRQKIVQELNACDALIAVIGKDWTGIRDAQGRPRLHHDRPIERVMAE